MKTLDSKQLSKRTNTTNGFTWNSKRRFR